MLLNDPSTGESLHDGIRFFAEVGYRESAQYINTQIPQDPSKHIPEDLGDLPEVYQMAWYKATDRILTEYYNGLALSEDVNM